MTTDNGKKPREFWILPQKGSDCEWTNLYPDESWKSETKPLIHVREVTPCANCERLEAEFRSAKNAGCDATCLNYRDGDEEIQRLQKRLEMCKDALDEILGKNEYCINKEPHKFIADECLAKLEK